MSRKILPVRNREGVLYGYAHWCQGCRLVHIFHVIPPGPVWSFNNDMEKPTFDPSMREFMPARKDANGKIVKPEITLCHYFLKDGEIDFLPDSSYHQLRGKHSLQDIPEDYGI